MLSSISYKAEHEAFVSNLKGTSAACLIACLAHFPISIILIKLVQKNSSPLYLRDLMFVVFPMLLSLTILADYTYISLAAALLIELLTLQRIAQNRMGSSDPHRPLRMFHGKDSEFSFPPGPPTVCTSTTNNNNTNSNNSTTCSRSKTYFITLFKGGTMLITCICILAVDFRIFPRRFAKTETFGLSLMDVGTSMFIVSSAITSRYARGIHQSTLTVHTASNTTVATRTVITQRYRDFMQRSAVLILGVGRLVILKLLNYPEHVSEYGIHWNFFVSIFCVWMLADMCHSCFPRWAMPWIASGILFIYQFSLTYLGLSQYILAAPRNNFMSANREGIFSLGGLLPLYLLSEHAAYHVFFSPRCSLQLQDIVDHENGINVSSDINSPLTPHQLLALKSSSCQDIAPDRATNSNKNVISSAATYNSSTCREITVPGSDEDDDWLVSANTSYVSTFPDVSQSTSGGSTGTRHRAGLSLITNATDSTRKGYERVIHVLGLPWRALIQPQHRPPVRPLLTLSLSLWSFWILTSMFVELTSRRLANVSFVLFSLALSYSMLLGVLLADSVAGGSEVRVRTLELFSTNQLPIFIASNLLTGSINITIRTHYAKPTIAFLILFVYISAVVAVAWLMGTRASKEVN